MNPRILLASDEIRSLTKDRIIKALVGTEDAALVGASLREGRLGLNVLGDELFDRYIGESFGKQVARHIYVRRSAAESLVGSIVHEGKHGLDQLAGFGRHVPRTRGAWESRAIRSEFDFYKANGIPDEYLAYPSVEDAIRAARDAEGVARWNEVYYPY